MQIYNRRIFEANEESKAKRFCYRVKGACRFTQNQDSNGNIKNVYVVEYIPKS